MKSIKPGRGPSAMGSIGSAFAAVFGILWTLAAASMGAPIFFVLFGVAFVVLGIVQALYHWKNATGETRFSTFDIVDSDEEPDPLDRRPAEHASSQGGASAPSASGSSRFCPYCGAKVQGDFEFCNQCGKRLP